MTGTAGQARTVPGNKTVGPVLRDAHAIWIEETDSFLTPILSPEASFWERWTAVRYLADQFLEPYRREYDLIKELRPFLPAEQAESLLRRGQRIAQLQGKLDRIGRRRGTGRTSAVVARELLEAVRSWCADIETAAGEIERESLPEEAQRILAEVALYCQTHA